MSPTGQTTLSPRPISSHSWLTVALFYPGESARQPARETCPNSPKLQTRPRLLRSAQSVKSVGLIPYKSNPPMLTFGQTTTSGPTRFIALTPAS